MIDRLRFEATLDGFAEAAQRLRERLQAIGADADLTYKIELAFEEVSTNIIRHGQARGKIEVSLEFGDREVALAFEDDGSPFDPRNRPPRVVPSSLDDAETGGLGLHLLATLVTRMDYQRTRDGRNRLTLFIARP